MITLNKILLRSNQTKELFTKVKKDVIVDFYSVTIPMLAIAIL